ncbi:hypothetical protein C8R43DRAFT_1178093 [Mycena crocata]|nr:hypothetical protein C8R43DRAFT_1178093 [Mycena crocata]
MDLRRWRKLGGKVEERTERQRVPLITSGKKGTTANDGEFYTLDFVVPASKFPPLHISVNTNTNSLAGLILGKSRVLVPAKKPRQRQWKQSESGREETNPEILMNEEKADIKQEHFGGDREEIRHYPLGSLARVAATWAALSYFPPTSRPTLALDSRHLSEEISTFRNAKLELEIHATFPAFLGFAVIQYWEEEFTPFVFEALISGPGIFSRSENRKKNGYAPTHFPAPNASIEQNNLSNGACLRSSLERFGLMSDSAQPGFTMISIPGGLGSFIVHALPIPTTLIPPLLIPRTVSWHLDMRTNNFMDEQPAIFAHAESDIDIHSRASSAGSTSAAVMAGLVPVLQDPEDELWSRIKGSVAAKRTVSKPEDQVEIDSLFGDDPEELNPGAPELGDACDGHWEVPHDVFPRPVAQEHENYAPVAADAMPLWQNSDNSVSVSQDAPFATSAASHSHPTDLSFTHVTPASDQTFGCHYDTQHWNGAHPNAFGAHYGEHTPRSYLPHPMAMSMHPAYPYAWNHSPLAYPHRDLATANEIRVPPSYATYPSNLYGVPRALSTAVHHAYMATPFSGDHPYLAASGYVVNQQGTGGQVRGAMEQVSPWPSFPPGQQDASLYGQQPLRAGYEQQQQRAAVGWNFGYQNATAPTNNANVAGYKGHHIRSPSEGSTGPRAAAAPSGNSSGSDSSASTTEAASSPSNPKKRKAPDFDAATLDAESATAVTETSTTAKGKSKQRSRKGKARASPATSSQGETNPIAANSIKQEVVEAPAGKSSVALVVHAAQPNHVFRSSYPCEWTGCLLRNAGTHGETGGSKSELWKHLVQWHGVPPRKRNQTTADKVKSMPITCMWGDCNWGPGNSRKRAAPSGIATHIAKDHLRSSLFTCRYCKEEFPNKDLLSDHFPTCREYLTPAVVQVEEPAYFHSMESNRTVKFLTLGCLEA